MSLHLCYNIVWTILSTRLLQQDLPYQGFDTFSFNYVTYLKFPLDL